MTLREFVEKFICRNSLIRLWTKDGAGHQLIFRTNERCPEMIDSVCMEWQLIKGTTWHNDYAECKVIGIKDIYMDDFYREAINIVIEV